MPRRLALATLILFALAPVRLSANEGRLSSLERDASYCFGIAQERYSGYLIYCKDEPAGQCRHQRELEINDAARKPVMAYLERRGLLFSGTRVEADKNESRAVSSKGRSDYLACFDYLQKAIQGCLSKCDKSPKQGACLTECRGWNNQPCVRIDACGDTFEPGAAP
jgi:hypothetical protein